jgi:type II secretory pathway component PulJ
MTPLRPPHPADLMHDEQSAAAQRSPGEAGFTLIEVLVATITSMVVALALFAIIEFGFRQTASVAERVNANQRGRLAMENVLNYLHSSCVSVSAVPVLEKSTNSSLYILSQEGSQAFFTSMTRHRIYLASNGTLYDAYYNSTGGIAPNWTFPAETSPTGTRVLLTNVSQSGSTPVFRYFKYEGGSLSETELPATAPSGLSAANAKATAAVTVTFTVAPETKAVTGVSKSIELSNTALLRFDPASTTSQDTPCQ